MKTKSTSKKSYKQKVKEEISIKKRIQTLENKIKASKAILENVKTLTNSTERGTKENILYIKSNTQYLLTVLLDKQSKARHTYHKSQEETNSVNLRHLVCTLYTEEGLTMKEFADNLGCQEDDIHLLIHRGKVSRELIQKIFNYFELDFSLLKYRDYIEPLQEDLYGDIDFGESL